MPESEQPKGFFLSDRIYNVLRSLSRVVLPCTGAIIFVVDRFAPLPKALQLLGAIITIDFLIGVFLVIVNYFYNASEAKYAGTINVVLGTHGGKIFSLELKEDPENLDTHDEVTFKVQPG